jgi:hypothetical protein
MSADESRDVGRVGLMGVERGLRVDGLAGLLGPASRTRRRLEGIEQRTRFSLALMGIRHSHDRLDRVCVLLRPNRSHTSRATKHPIRPRALVIHRNHDIAVREQSRPTPRPTGNLREWKCYRRRQVQARVPTAIPRSANIYSQPLEHAHEMRFEPPLDFRTMRTFWCLILRRKMFR